MVSRRNLLLVWALLGALGIAGILAVPVGASPDGARTFIKSLGDSAVDVLANDTIDTDTRNGELHKLFLDGFDTHTIGLFVLGRHWRSASKRELQEYINLFETFVVRSYASRLGQYAGETLEITGSRGAGDRDVIVTSEIRRPSGPPLRVDWRVRHRDGAYKIVDVIVEGVSMLITQRDEFASVIRASGGNLRGLLVALREKTATP